MDASTSSNNVKLIEYFSTEIYAQIDILRRFLLLNKKACIFITDLKLYLLWIATIQCSCFQLYSNSSVHCKRELHFFLLMANVSSVILSTSTLVHLTGVRSMCFDVVIFFCDKNVKQLLVSYKTSCTQLTVFQNCLSSCMILRECRLLVFFFSVLILRFWFWPRCAVNMGRGRPSESLARRRWPI